MKLSDQAKQVLRTLAAYGKTVDDPRRGNYPLNGERLQQLTGFLPDVLNDAVEVLEIGGHLKVHRALGSSPFGFVQVKLTATGRQEAQSIIENDVARFQDFAKLGEGVYGDVWRARDTKLKRAVAIKFVRTNGPADFGALEHARALARVEHPNIVVVYDVENVIEPVSGDDAQAVVMELVEGRTLTEQLGYVLTREEAQRIGLSLIEAIREYHARGLAHGDLHDGNVIVGTQHVKVLDPLYFDSSLMSSTASRQSRQGRDVRFIRDLLVQLLSAAQVSSEVVAHFAGDLRRQDLLAMRAAFLEGLSVDSRQAVAIELDPLVDLLATKPDGGGFKLINLAAELGWRPSEVRTAVEDLYHAGIIRLFVLNDNEVVYEFSERSNAPETEEVT